MLGNYRVVSQLVASWVVLSSIVRLVTLTKSSGKKLIYIQRSAGQSVLASGCHLEPVTRFCFLSDNWVGWFGSPSLTRGWVCNLLVQLLVGLARAVNPGSKSHRTQIIFYSHLRLPQPGGPGSHIYIPQEQGGPVTPGHWVPFLSPLTTRRATVEVF
jgi:hypothetical protein